VRWGVATAPRVGSPWVLEKAGLEKRDRGVINAERLRGAAAQNQSLAHLGAPGKGGEAMIAIVAVAHEAGRHMGNRLETCGANGGYRLDLKLEIGWIDQRHIYTCPGRQ